MSGVRIQVRRGTSAEWSSINPVLFSGEPAYEEDTKKRKTGDGVTPWNNLPYDPTPADVSAAQAAATAAASTDATTKAGNAQSAAQAYTDTQVATRETPSGAQAKADSAQSAAQAHADQIAATKADLVGGLVPTSQIPALAITDTFPVASQAAMLALTAQRGDVAIRSDLGTSFILSADDPTQLANWVELPAAGKVTSVNGHQGVIVLAKADIGLDQVNNTSDANKPVSGPQSAADSQVLATATGRSIVNALIYGG